MAELAVEEIGIRVGAEEGRLEIGVAAGRDGRRRRLLRVGVEIAEQQNVRIACGRNHGAVDPGEETIRLTLARGSETGLAVA